MLGLTQLTVELWRARSPLYRQLRLARKGAFVALLLDDLQDLQSLTPLESVEKKPTGEKQAETKRDENAKRPRQPDPSRK